MSHAEMLSPAPFAQSRYVLASRQTSSSTSKTTPPQNSRNFNQDATIVLIGSRGSGKRSLAFVGATHLGRRLIVEDFYFEDVTGYSRRNFLSTHGNKAFLKKNVEVLQKMLDENRTGCIVECGMASLARGGQEALKTYARTNPVIYVLRNAERVRKLLKLSDSEASRLEQADSIHRSCSNFEYYNLHDPSCENHIKETSHDRASPAYSSGLKDAKQDFSDFLDFLTGTNTVRRSFDSQFSLNAVAAEQRPYTYTLAIRLSALLRRAIDLSELDSGGADTVMLRVDIRVPSMLSVLDKQMSLIRRRIRLPVIFQIEDQLASADSLYAEALLHHALRTATDYVVVSLDWPNERILNLVRAKGSCKIIGHYLDSRTQPNAWTDGFMESVYQRGLGLGCDLVRTLRVAIAKRDNNDCQTFLDNNAAIHGNRSQLIAYNLGSLGRDSLITNRTFTPVTHPAVASSQSGDIYDPIITAREAMQTLYERSVLDVLNFYIYGASVSYSLSPAMHNAAYDATGLGHNMQPYQAATLDDLHRLSQDPHFGGVGIAQPFKVSIMAQLQSYSHHAAAIGSVNTILPLRDTSKGLSQLDFLYEQAGQRNKARPIAAWHGENTDWQGITNCLRRNVSPRNVVQPSRTTGLVIGAGGMARAAVYAMIQLGCRRILIYNRTIDRAKAVAAHFNSWASSLSQTGEVVTVLKSREDPWPMGCNPATLIVSCVPAHRVGTCPAADFQMPLQWLGSPSGGVIMELAYKPRMTPLLAQISHLRSIGLITTSWVTVGGVDFIPEQGIAQFELMTGRKAPRSRMREEMAKRLEYQELLEQESQKMSYKNGTI